MLKCFYYNPAPKLGSQFFFNGAKVHVYKKQERSSSFHVWSAVKCFTCMLDVCSLPVDRPIFLTIFPPNPLMSDTIVNSGMTGTVGCTSRDVGVLHIKDWTTYSSMSQRKEDAGRGEFKREKNPAVTCPHQRDGFTIGGWELQARQSTREITASYPLNIFLKWAQE